MNNKFQENNIKIFVRKAVLELLEDPELEPVLIEDTKLEEYFDSISLVNLMVQIEQEFDILYEPEEIGVENFDSIQIITKFIMDKAVSTQLS